MVFLIILIVLVVLGLIDARYLYYKHKTKLPLSCPLNSDCNAVINSKWNELLGVKNEVWGMLYYATLLLLILASR